MPWMTRKPLLAAFVLTTALGGAGCAHRTRVVYVYAPTPPPAAVREVRSAAPGRDYVWIPGHHRWEGRAYVWVPGQWARVPAHRRHWVEGHWAHDRHGWYWVEGRWR